MTGVRIPVIEDGMSISRRAVMTKNTLFMQMLVSRGIVGEESAEMLDEKYGEDTFAVLMHLVRAGVADRTLLGRMWADSNGTDYVDLGSVMRRGEIVRRLPESFAARHHILLMHRSGSSIVAALSNPTDPDVIRQAEDIAASSIQPAFAFPEEIEEAIEIEYRSEEQLADLSRKIVTETLPIDDIGELTREQLHKVAGTQAVVGFVQTLLLLGLRDRAGEIHIEPADEKIRVRFRIDGMLQDRCRMEKIHFVPVIARLKILADLDIAERNAVQYGRVNLKLPTRTVAFRLCSVPSVWGEKVVLRIEGQPVTGDVPDLYGPSFAGSIRDTLKNIFEAPQGIFLVTGPAGSGKGSALLAVIDHLKKAGLSITAIEDAIEYRVDGITRIRPDKAAGFDFITALKSCIWQDSEVIVVGNAGDEEKAKAVFQAALTGRLLLATLDAGNAAQAVARILDMGVKPVVLASSLLGILSQKLVRRICERCREEYAASEEEMENLFRGHGKEARFYRGMGCRSCNFTGYCGTIAVHEILRPDEKMRSMIARGDSMYDVYEHAGKSGFQTMRYDGLKKVLRGLTTLDEINRAVNSRGEMQRRES